MDPLDDFQFKPLTEGLGFHKKKNEPAPTSRVQSTTNSEAGFTENRRTEARPETRANTLLETPLPRRRQERARTIPTIEDEVSPGNSAVDEILKTLNKKKDLDFINKPEMQKQTPAAAAKKAPATTTVTSTELPSFMAATLDAMLIIAASLLCLIVMLTITKVDLIGNLTRPDGDGMVYTSTVALFLAVTFIYMVVHRVFMGATPGEWAFDQQLGTDEQINRPTYVLKVISRTLLTMVTGFVVLPLLSMLFQRDLAGNWTGAPLTKKI